MAGVRLNIGETTGRGLGDFVRAERARRREEREAARLAEEEASAGKVSDETMRDWAVLVPERGKALDFYRFPFQEEWFSEEIARAIEVCWMKAAQVGMSGYAWRWGGRRAARYGDRVIYFFPTDDDVEKFGDQRIEPSINASPYLLKLIEPRFVRHKHLKQIGTGDLSLRGTNSKTAVQSVDGDALIFDEVDYHHQGNLDQALRRLAGAEAAGRTARKRWLGYPTIPGGQVHSRFEAGDKRVWTVTCPACGLEQGLDWGRNVRWRSYEGGDVCMWGHDVFEKREDVEEVWRACADCGETLEENDHQAIREGRWVAKNPEARTISYHVSRLIVPFTDLREMVIASRATDPTAVTTFYNLDLGLPYVPTEAALTREDVEAAMAYGGEIHHGYQGRNAVVAGFDVASERALSGWVDEILPDGRTRALWIGEPQDFQEVVDLIRRFRPGYCVIDGMPERRSAKAVAAMFPGVVTIASYDDRNEADAFKYDPKKNMVTVNRTEAIDAFMDGIRQMTRIPLRVAPPKFVDQLLAPKRTIVVSETTGKKKRVYVSTGPNGDDYTHAGVYALVAKEMYALRVHVQAIEEAAAGSILPDEQFGFREDGYRVGFGETRW